jgi:hypothetical protein
MINGKRKIIVVMLIGMFILPCLHEHAQDYEHNPYTYKNYDGIGLASMQFFNSKSMRLLQKVARWTFHRQRSLMREIINTLRVQEKRNTQKKRAYATIIRLGEGKILSPYPEFEEHLNEFHRNADLDSYTYLNEVAANNRVRLIVFSSIDEFILEDFIERNQSGDLEIYINIYFAHMGAFAQESLVLPSSVFKGTDTTRLRKLIRDSSAVALKSAIDDKTTLF